MKSAVLLLSFLLLNASIAAHAACPTASDGLPDVTLQPIVTGLKQPVYLAAPRSDARLFIVEQAGRVRIAAAGRLQAEDFLDIRDRVDSGGEKGLLSIAFHPDYARNGLFTSTIRDAKTASCTLLFLNSSAARPDKRTPRARK